MTLQQRLSDQELVALLKTGNQAAFTEIYDRYWQTWLIPDKEVVNNKIAQNPEYK